MNRLTEADLACRCCGKEKVHPKLLEMLNIAQQLYGRRLQPTSGYRCPAHNAEVGGAKTSAHLMGEAVDVSCIASKERLKLVSAFLSAGFTRIGIGRGFIHIDISATLPQNVLWLY